LRTLEHDVTESDCRTSAYAARCSVRAAGDTGYALAPLPPRPPAISPSFAAASAGHGSTCRPVMTRTGPRRCAGKSDRVQPGSSSRSSGMPACTAAASHQRQVSAAIPRRWKALTMLTRPFASAATPVAPQPRPAATPSSPARPTHHAGPNPADRPRSPQIPTTGAADQPVRTPPNSCIHAGQRPYNWLPR
jgi:hypothetical protein